MKIPSFKEFLNESKEWTEEEIKLEAEKYTKRFQFKNAEGKRPMYNFAVKHYNELLDEIYGKNVKWTDDSVRAEAAKYKNREDFRNHKKGAFSYADKHGMLDELFGKAVHWDDDSVRAEAAKYDSKEDFKKGSKGAHDYAYRHNMLNDFDWFVGNGDNRPRCVYAYIDKKNKVAYVGLTVNKEERDKTHRTGIYRGLPCESSVYKYFKSINEEVPAPIYLEDNLKSDESQEKEDYYKSKFEKEGYFMLNKAKTGLGSGSLGKKYKWNDETVKAEASKYSTKQEFKQSKGAYNYAYDHKMLDDLFGESVHWDLESVKIEASKYKNPHQFKIGKIGAYEYAKRNHIMKDLFPNKKAEV